MCSQSTFARGTSQAYVHDTWYNTGDDVKCVRMSSEYEFPDLPNLATNKKNLKKLKKKKNTRIKIEPDFEL